MNRTPGNPDTPRPSRRAILTGGLAALATTHLTTGCSMVSDGVVAGVGNTLNPSRKPRTIYDLKDTGGAAGMIEQFIGDVWHGKFSRAFSVNPEEVARQVTRNPMGVVVANLKRLFIETMLSDSRLRKRLSKQDIERVSSDILSRFGSDSFYDFTLSVTQASESVSVRDSIRQELLGPDRVNAAHYHQQFEEFFDPFGNKQKGNPDDSRICVILIAQKILNRRVNRKDLIGIVKGAPKHEQPSENKKSGNKRDGDAVMDFATQRVLAALAKRIDRRMEIVYQRYKLE
jgi:hypothetical protein